MATKKKTKETKAVEKSLVSGLKLEKLRKFNLWIAFIFLIQAVAVVLFGGSKTAPITTTFLSVDELQSQASGHQVLAGATRHLFDVRLTVLAAIFLVVLAIGSWLMSTICRAYYEIQLQRASSSARWLNVSLASGFIIATFGIEGGIRDIGTLLAIFTLTVLGLGLMPAINKMIPGGHQVAVKGIFYAAVTSIVIPWVMLAGVVIGALIWNGHIPGNVYFMYVTGALLFGCWLLAGRFHLAKRGKWTDIFYAEKMYMLLSLALGTIVAWQIFAGAL